MDITAGAQFTIVHPSSNNSHDVVNFHNNVYIRNGSVLNAGDGDDMVYKYNNVIMSDNSKFQMSNGVSATTISNLTCGNYNTVAFNNSGGSTTITGTLTANADCSNWIWLKCIDNTGTANISFSSAQTITSVVCSDLNVTSANLTNTGGVNMDNNTGITFTSPTTGTTFYWIGGTTGNPKSYGNNENWTNPSNWSQSSGNTGTGNSCIPGPQDNIIFDNNSFTDGVNTDVNIDIRDIACNNITWTNVASGVTFDNATNNSDAEFTIFGNLTLDGANMTNNFEGTTIFTSHNTTGTSINSNGARFFGTVYFNYTGKTWTIADNMNIEGDGRGDFIIENGTVSLGTNNISLTDDWHVYSTGTFNCGTGTVNFDGQNSNTTNQLITNPGNDHFYNITVNRQNGGGARNTVRLANAIYIDNDFIISKGRVEDYAYQIYGNSSGIMTMANNTRLVLSNWPTTRVTKFPTAYTSANISLANTSRVYFYSRLNQEVSGVPDYGYIYINNTSGGNKTKTLTEAVTINKFIHIDDNNTFYDNGFQITGNAAQNAQIRIDNNAVLVLGDETNATTFSSEFTLLDLNTGSTVVYNSGVNQTVRGLNATSPEDGYYHLIIRDSVAGTVTKTIDANTMIRGDLTIESNNTFDVDISNNYNIEIKGDWINQGTFNARNAQVSFTGSSEQQVTSNSSSFYNVVFNNTNATGITLLDIFDLTNSADFTDGVVNSTTSNKFIFEDNVTWINASNACHIDGSLTKIGNDSFIFPVGDAGIYAPIEISTPSNLTDEFTAEYHFASPPYNFWAPQAMNNLDHVSSIEYWDFTRDVGTSTPTIKLFWYDGTRSDIADLPDLRVAHWNSSTSKWDNMGGLTTGTLASGTIVSTVPFSSYSPISFGTITPDNPLPISLLDFNVELESGIVNINWETQTEINNDYFVVEKSRDNINYKLVRKHNGAGNSNNIIYYKSYDKNPYKGISYYRLKQVDIDGNYKYFGPVAIDNNKDSNFKFIIYPNPVVNGNNLIIETNKLDDKLNISIVDIRGRHIDVSYSINENTLSIDTKSIDKGIYFIIIELNTNIYRKKFIVE